MQMKKILLFAPLLLFMMQACTPENSYPASVEGYVPIYATDAELKEIKSLGPQDYVNPGKIYSYAGNSLQVDVNRGIHVINSSDPSNPQKVAFIQVKGCSEISIKDGALYTNNNTDLIALDITDINNVVVKSRIEDAFPIATMLVPPVNGFYYECVDESKGTVIGWNKQTIQNPKCYLP